MIYEMFQWTGAFTFETRIEVVGSDGATLWTRGDELSPLPPGGISGTVADETGDPLGSICVALWSGEGEWLTDMYSSHDGRYEFWGLDAGAYKVEFLDCDEGLYEEQWYDGKPTMAAADVVTVADEVVEGIDAAMAPAG